MPNFRSHGFTLIELLVVISIISLLSSIVFAGLSSARVKARDSVRLSDVKQIRMALNLYYDKYGYYPDSSSCCWFDNGKHYNGSTLPSSQWIPGLIEFIPTVPKEPGTLYAWDTGNYEYYGSGNSYCLWVSFERVPNNTIADAKTVWGRVNAFCENMSAD